MRRSPPLSQCISVGADVSPYHSPARSVGLAEGVEERVEKEDPKWRVNGKWAVVSFAPSSSQ